MKKTLLLFWLLLCAVKHMDAQRYLVRFQNKGSSAFSLSNPSAFLSSAAIERRQRYGISLDSTDLPVTQRYIDSIRSVTGVTVLNVSKWLNQVSVQITSANTTAALARINSFPFVIASSKIGSRLAGDGMPYEPKEAESEATPVSAQRLQATTANVYNYGSNYNQIHIHNGEFLHNIGLRGQNMTIGILDAGFKLYTTLKAFDSVNINGQVLSTWDFVARHAGVVEDDNHGMQVFSTIAANVPGKMVGSAPRAKFHLFRTEEGATEYLIEEHNWVCAAERVDSAGSHVLSSSLGYRTFQDATMNHTYADMNGNTTIAAIGADLAAKKGLLVFNSAGNDGTISWKYISTPADADSILVVGSVNSSGVPAPSSSYGPSSDGQVKPDLASIGAPAVVWNYNNDQPGSSNGTSFATPNLAGLATCLWQGFPEFNNMKIISALRQSGHKYTNPDDRVGYGIPDIRKAFSVLVKDFATVSGTITGCKTALSWTTKDVSTMKFEIERKSTGENTFVKIGELSGTGSELATHTYQFNDELIGSSTGMVSYRVRQIVDTAGGTTIADYIGQEVSLNKASGCSDAPGEVLTIAPNPVPSGTQIIIKATTADAIQNLNIRFVNAQGQTIAIIKKTKPSGAISIPLDISFLSKGQYFVSIYRDDQLLATKELLRL